MTMVCKLLALFKQMLPKEKNKYKDNPAQKQDVKLQKIKTSNWNNCRQLSSSAFVQLFKTTQVQEKK